MLFRQFAAPPLPTSPSHAFVIITVIGVPVVATVVMAVAEGLVESLGWRIRLCRLGWDLCVLAVGVSGGIFTQPGVVQRWGPEWSIAIGSILLMFEILLGLTIIHLRKTKPADLKGWQAYTVVGLGIASLVLPWYVVVRS